MLEYIILLISWFFLVLGGFFIITSAVGCLRLPDFYSRLHAAGIGDSCGVPMILLGIIIHNGFNQFSFKIFLLIIFLFITSPTACHALAKSAYIFNLKNKSDNE
ncbi:MAG: monovalent cation/H(+) antiporter subunit G [Alphaproteobacteria bacterium]